MTLGDQLREVTGREVEIWWEHDLQRHVGIQTAKEWRAYLSRYTDLLDFREVLEGRAELGSFPLLIMRFDRGGLHLEFHRPNEALNRRRAA